MGLIASNTAATTVAVTNRIVTSVDMKVGAYAIANASPAWGRGAFITATVTQVDTLDTMGTLVVVGKNLSGQTISETLTPAAGSTVTSTKVFRSVTSVTGVGWVIDQVEGTEDTIVVGVAAGNIACGSPGQLGGVLVNNAVAAAVTISDARGTILTIPASQAAGTYYNLQGVNFAGYLKVATTNTNDVTVFHTSTLPMTYALS